MKINAGTMFGITNTMMEVNDHLASDYIVDHYNELMRQAIKFGVHEENASDVVQDVYVSMVRSENNGEGYDMNNGNRGALISLDQFVYGRLKGYCRNQKYHGNATYGVEISASNFASSELRDMSSAQRAYENAPSFDEIDALENKLCLKSNIELLIDYNDCLDIDIRYILKNIYELTKMKFDASIMNSIRALIREDSDFAEALTSVIQFAGIKPDVYRDAVAML